jgi:VWFA-related protein
MQRGIAMSAKWAWVLLAVTYCGLSTAAQAPVPATAAATATPIQLDVVVTDKTGKPIPGLKQEDFTLVDDRQQVAISSFKDHAAVDGGGAALIIVLDNLNADFNDVTTERLQLEGYFRRNGGKLANPTGVFLLNESGLEVVTPISTDGNTLADGLHRKIVETRMARVTAGFYSAEERVNTSLQALSALGRILNVDGRKLVVWLGPGWPVIDNSEANIGPDQQQFLFNTATAFSRMLREERITIDVVNLVASSSGNGATGESGSELFWESYRKPLVKQNKAQPGNIALQVFAEHSGGTVVLGSNDIAKEITRCAQDATAWYTLTFEPQKANSPNTWHDVEVKIDKPQAKLRTENGYYAQP